MRFVGAAATDAGRVRRDNEDRYLVDPHVVVVADGMGGHRGGSTASALAVEALRVLATVPHRHHADIVTTLSDANRAVVTRAALDPALAGMGTTVTGVTVVEVDGVPHCAVFNVGDSRVYRLSAGALQPLTTDHSEVQELVDAGRLTAAAARHHPGRHVITRSLGTVPAPQVDLRVVGAQDGERLLVCSDGLTGELEEDVIAHVLLRVTDPDAAARALVDAALAAGGRDNVTVVVVDVVLETADRGLDQPTAPRSRVPGPS